MKLNSVQCNKCKCKVKARTRESTPRFTEVPSQRLIYVIPRAPQDLLPPFAINSYGVWARISRTIAGICESFHL